MALPEYFRPSAAGAFLDEVRQNKLPNDGTQAQRAQILDAARGRIAGLKDWSWHMGRVAKLELGQNAWGIAYTALGEAGLPGWAEVAKSRIEAGGGETGRWVAGESGGWLNPHAVQRALDESVEDARLLVADVGEGSERGFKALRFLSRNWWWLLPTAVGGTVLWVAWPVVSSTLMARKMAKARLTQGLQLADAAAGQQLMRAEQHLLPAGQHLLPAPAGHRDLKPEWSAGQWPDPQWSDDEAADLLDGGEADLLAAESMPDPNWVPSWE